MFCFNCIFDFKHTNKKNDDNNDITNQNKHYNINEILEHIKQKSSLKKERNTSLKSQNKKNPRRQTESFTINDQLFLENDEITELKIKNVKNIFNRER